MDVLLSVDDRLILVAYSTSVVSFGSPARGTQLRYFG